MLLRLLPTLLVTALLGVAAGDAAGQQLSGVVRDGASGRPLAQARVHLLPGDRVAVTDDAGAFSFLRLEAAAYTLSIEALGYVKREVEVRVRPGQPATVSITMDVAPLPLDPVQAEADARATRPQLGGFWGRRERGVGMFITPEDIEARRGQRFTDLFRTVPGARIQRLDAIGAGHIVTFGRGSDACAAVLYLDGVLFPLTEAGWDVLRLDEVEAVEVYSGPARVPPQFNQTGGAGTRGLSLPPALPRCGVVVVWTRRGGARR